MQNDNFIARRPSEQSVMNMGTNSACLHACRQNMLLRHDASPWLGQLACGVSLFYSEAWASGNMQACGWVASMQEACHRQHRVSRAAGAPAGSSARCCAARCPGRSAACRRP